MTDPSTCPACGTPLAQGRRRGMCPACLLRAALGPDSTLRQAPGEDDAEQTPPGLSEQPGTRIGHYKLLEQIGEGGFGVVWMAEQEEPVRRRVALKIIKLGMDTREVVTRFEAERQALAMMEHPNIASVFDGGATDTGRPYFVMELVKGVPITTYCDANQLSTCERLELFLQICNAVQHAHQKGVIHRDLKPSNILVTVKDDRPVPKVIDFGIAKATQARLTERTLFTRFNQWIGTPAYMSPEQAGLGSLDIDTRSDIYSLGVLLYELLTGRPPFDPEELLAAGYDAVMKAIREEDPLKPSTRLGTLTAEELSRVATHHHVDPAKLARSVRGDLDWIVMKALDKDRTRRYQTANALARDLELHLNQEPVSAVAPTLGYRLRKLVRRHRKAAAWTLSFALMLVLTAMVGTTLAIYAQRQKVRAVIAEHTALDNLYAADIALAQQALDLHQLERARELLLNHIPKPGEVDRRGIEWRKLWTDARGNHVAVIPTPIRGTIWGLAFTPNDEFIVATGGGGILCVIQAEDFKPVFSTTAASGECCSLALSPDGKLVAVGSAGSKDSSASVWKMSPDGSLELVWRVAGRNCYGLAFSHDARTLAVGMESVEWPDGGNAGITRLFDVASGRQLAELPESGGRAVAFSNDGNWLVTAPGKGKAVNLWDARKLSLIQSVTLEGAISLAISPDNQLLFAGNSTGSADYYRLPSLAPVFGRLTKYGHPWNASFSTTRPLLASCDGPVIVVRDLANWVGGAFFGRETELCSVGFDHRGDWLVAGSTDGKIQLWNASGGNQPRLTAPAERHTLRYHRSMPLPPSSPSGTKIAVLAVDGVRVLDAGRWQTSPPLCPTAFPLAFDGEDSLLVMRGLPWLEERLFARPPANPQATRLEWWNLSTTTHVGVEVADLAGKHVTTVAVSPDRTMVALAWRDGEKAAGLAFVDSRSGEVRGGVVGKTGHIYGLGFAPDGRTLAMATGSRVELIAFPSGEKLKSLEGSTKTHAERPAFSPDGHLLAVGYGDRIALWSVPDGRLLRFLGGYRGQVASLLFSADSKTLVGWGETKFWHLPTFRETLHLETQSNVSRPWIPLTGEQFVCFRNDSVSWEVAALAPLEHSEEWLRDQPASLTEARRIVNRFPPRDPKTPPDLIALDAWYSLPFDRDFLNGALGNGLATLPCGVQLLKQTAFDIRAVVMPNQSGRNALQVGRTCARLRFLHNSFGRETQAGRTIGRYVIHYADGQMAEVPLLIGRNIQNWWADPAGLASSGEAEVAWVGANPRTGDSDQTIHLLILTWQNPRPEVAVRAVDFEKAGWDTQPFLVALTAE